MICISYAIITIAKLFTGSVNCLMCWNKTLETRELAKPVLEVP